MKKDDSFGAIERAGFIIGLALTAGIYALAIGPLIYNYL
ncbi:hypothetical protein BLJAPNOD_06165 [Ensifer sp. M14]|nr:hypothetical protein BLJAPNOD_06165 [Ensifer sp. M14]